MQSHFPKMTQPVRDRVKIAIHVRLTPAGLQAATSPSWDISIISNSSAVGPIKPNLLKPYIYIYFHPLFLLLCHDPWKKPWVGRRLCFILWLTENNWERFPVSVSLPPRLCLPLLTYTRACTQPHTSSHTSLSLCWKALSSSELIDSVSPMAEQAYPPSSSVQDKTTPMPAPGLPAQISKALAPLHSFVRSCSAHSHCLQVAQTCILTFP